MRCKKKRWNISGRRQTWNIEEIAVSAEYGKKIKVLGAADKHHGEARAQSSDNRSKHITALVAISSSGRKCPPRFIIAGKNVMSGWFRSLTSVQCGQDKTILGMTHADWFTNDCAGFISENDSMESRLIKLVVQHISKFSRLFVPNQNV